MSSPTKEHMNAAKRILRYLKCTPKYGIVLGGGEPILTCFVDSAYATDETRRRSSTGYICYLGTSPISWCSKLQKSVALSTTESEYMAMCDASKDVVWLRGLLKALQEEQRRPTVVNQDNVGAIYVANNSTFHKRTKHIDVRYHYTRDLLEERIIHVNFCPTNFQIADILTKATRPGIFKDLRQYLVKTHWDEGNVENLYDKGLSVGIQKEFDLSYMVY